MGTSAAQKRLFFNLKKTKKNLQRIDDTAQLTPDEIRSIAKDLNVNEQDVIDMDQRMSASDQRLDAPITRDGEGGQWMDLLADPSESHETTLGDHQEFQQKHEMLMEAMESLNARERDIIVHRRLSEDQVTLEELSQRYSISRERVRQIEARALEKMTAHVLAAAAKPVLPAPRAA